MSRRDLQAPPFVFHRAALMLLALVIAGTGFALALATDGPPLARAAGTNVALGKPATQSSTYDLGCSPAGKAVDGNTDGNWFGACSVATTGYDAQAWWQVDLQSVYAVDTIVLWNRTDCCPERLSNFDVWVSTDGSIWTPFGYDGAAPTTTTFAIHTNARYVKVQLRGSNYLQLAEVQVWTTPAFIVTTLADSGPGSLRQAMLDANAATGADTITFAVSGTIVLATALPDITDAASLVIDGSGQAVTVSGNHSVRPFTISASGVLELRRVTITDGLASGGECGLFCAFTGTGGGISNGGRLSIVSSTLRGNGASHGGESDPFNSGNYSSGFGGGIYNYGTLTVTSSTISGNTAEAGSSHSFGVCSFSSPGLGAGIYNNGILTVTNSTISGNIGHNEPANCGGNTDDSGGIFNSGAATLTNSTISGNTGSGIAGGGGLTVTNSTISGNASIGAGGGIRGAATLTNAIVAGNSAVSAPDCTGGLTATAPNLIGDPSGCTIIGTPPLTGDPKLGPLADNGGPTKTHALYTGSPAIGAGDDAVCAAAPVSGKDQRGVARPVGAHCDLGAYEGSVSSSLLTNGNYESGDLTGWTAGGTNGGIARVETGGSCFSANNTLGITLIGKHALNVRSSVGAPLDSAGVATSASFTLGTALSFRGLSENDDAAPAADPVTFEVRILKADGTVLSTQLVKTAVVTLSPGTDSDGCLLGEARDGAFSSHSIDTSAFAGQTGRVEFRQHTNVPGKGFFTLIDDVAVVG